MLLLYDLLAWYQINIANTINIICLHMDNQTLLG